MSLRTSKEGSSSCQCTTTLNGKQKETKNNVNTIHRQLRNMLVNSLAVTGLSWSLDQKRSGAEKTRRIMGSNSREHDGKFLSIWLSDISSLQCLLEMRITKHRRGKRSQYTSMVVMKTSSCFSAQWSLRGETCSTWSFGKDGDSYRPLYCR